MKTNFCWTVSVLVLAAMGNSPVFAQAPSQPGPEHTLLKSLEGDWDAVVKMGPQESKGTSSTKMALGGLWLLTDFKAGIGGEAFSGHGIDGYDQSKKKFVSIWVDSMTSSPMTFEGTYDEKSKTLTMLGEGKGPDGNMAKFKGVTSYPDRDHQVFKMSLVDADGKDHLMMTIEYTRKK